MGSVGDDNTYSLLLLDLGLALSAGLLLRLALLQEGLRDQDIVLDGDGTKHLRLVRGPAYQRYEVERRWRTAAQVRHSLVADSIDSLVLLFGVTWRDALSIFSVRITQPSTTWTTSVRKVG